MTSPKPLGVIATFCLLPLVSSDGGEGRRGRGSSQAESHEPSVDLPEGVLLPLVGRARAE